MSMPRPGDLITAFSPQPGRCFQNGFGVSLRFGMSRRASRRSASKIYMMMSWRCQTSLSAAVSSPLRAGSRLGLLMAVLGLATLLPGWSSPALGTKLTMNQWGHQYAARFQAFGHDVTTIIYSKVTTAAACTQFFADMAYDRRIPSPPRAASYWRRMITEYVAAARECPRDVGERWTNDNLLMNALNRGLAAEVRLGNALSPIRSGIPDFTRSPLFTRAVSYAPGSQAAADVVAVGAGCPASTSSPANHLFAHWSVSPPMAIDPAAAYTATVTTTLGTFVIGLDAQAAPITVNNFVFLARQGYFHCVIFHRVIPGYIDQTGDPTGTGTGGPGYTILDENPPKTANPSLQYPLGSVAMANTGAPDSGGSQFFVVMGPAAEELPPTYALFGSVTSGMSVVQEINAEGGVKGTPVVTQRILGISISP
jgi:cyclophilin family peptidyl-prolyl cis-trans isomerase